MKLTSTVTFGLLLCLSMSAFAAEPAARPNIVLVLADDMGWSDLGCYGSEIPTPNIDALAADGVRFQQFYNNAVCGPTRASLLTGLYCQQIGHTGRTWNEPTNFAHCASVGDLLQRAGYQTMLVGKWQERQPPTEHGFDRHFGPACQGKISYFNEVENNPFFLDGQRYELPADFYMTDAFTDHAVKFIEDATAKKEGETSQPFFLYLAHIAPHWPLHAREADIAPHRQRYLDQGWTQWRDKRFERQKELGIAPSYGMSPLENIPLWGENIPDRAWQAERMAVYAAQVASVDQSVGRVMDALRKAGVDQNTVVIFLSDNGADFKGDLEPSVKGFGFSATLEDHWRLDGVKIKPGSGPDNMPGPGDTFAGDGPAWASVSNTPLRDYKASGYEGGIRTPCVVHWPGKIAEPGGISRQVGHVIDFVPTLLELAGTEYPQELNGRTLLPLEGISLVRTLTGGWDDGGFRVLCWAVPEHDVVLSGQYKLIRPKGGDKWEQYQLDGDAIETSDRADEYVGVTTNLKEMWQTWADRCAKDTEAARRDAPPKQ